MKVIKFSNKNVGDNKQQLAKILLELELYKVGRIKEFEKIKENRGLEKIHTDDSKKIIRMIDLIIESVNNLIVAENTISKYNR